MGGSESKIDSTSLEPAIQFVLNYGESVESLKRLDEKTVNSFNDSGKLIMTMIEKGSQDSGEANEQLQTLYVRMKKISEDVESNSKRTCKTHSHQMTGVIFYEDLVVGVEKLMRILREIYVMQNQESVDKFNLQYVECNPHEATKALLDDLHEYVTLDMREEMGMDPFKSRDTLAAWKSFVHNLLSSVCIAYAVFEGINGRSVKANCDEIDSIIRVEKEFNEFIEELQELKYWPEGVQELIVKTAESKEYAGNEEKAGHIAAEISNIYTEYKFHIIVYDACEAFGERTFIADMENVIFHQGDVHILVYRSIWHKYRTDAEYDSMEIRLEEMRNHDFYNDSSDGMKESTGEYFDAIRTLGFVGVIQKKFNVSYYSATAIKNQIAIGKSHHDPSLFQQLVIEFGTFVGHDEDTLRRGLKNDVIVITVPRQEKNERSQGTYTQF